MESGELEQLYLKWFENPIPPFGYAIGRPMPDDLKALIAAPNNRRIE